MFSPASIQLLYRNRLRIFYPSAEEALLDNYLDFTAQDICPVTHRVFRLGGLRGDARQLWRRLSGRPRTEPESRVVLQRINALSPSVLRTQLEEADLIICALGYRPHTIPFFDAGGRRVPLMADLGLRSVDSGCRVRLTDGRALPNVFSLGLPQVICLMATWVAKPALSGSRTVSGFIKMTSAIRFTRVCSAVLARFLTPDLRCALKANQPSRRGRNRLIADHAFGL
jgi:hypothetical protein